VAEVDELRRDQGAAQDDVVAGLQAELDRRIADHAADVAELERLRAGQEHGQAEAERLRTAAAEAQAVLDAARQEHAAAQAALEAARAEQQTARGDLDRRTAEHIALQAELAREQAAHEAAQSELGREQELRKAAEAQLEELRAAPPPALDPQDLERAAARLREQTPAPEPDVEEAPQEPAPRERPEQRDELARVLAAQQAAAERAAAPDPHAHLPALDIAPVVPVGTGDGAWLREAIRQVGNHDAALGAEVLLALAPIQAQVVRRKVAYQLTVNDAGTWRIAALNTMHMSIATGDLFSPGRRRAASCLLVAGSRTGSLGLVHHSWWLGARTIGANRSRSRPSAPLHRLPGQQPGAEQSPAVSSNG